MQYVGVYAEAVADLGVALHLRYALLHFSGGDVLYFQLLVPVHGHFVERVLGQVECVGGAWKLGRAVHGKLLAGSPYVHFIYAYQHSQPPRCLYIISEQPGFGKLKMDKM